MNEIWIRLYRIPGKNSARREPLKVTHAKDYIKNHYTTPVSRRDIARHIDVTPEHLNFLFKKFCSTTPMDFLADVRIREAKKLLQNANLNISQVSFRVGYIDPLYFSKVFKKKTGMTPRSFANKI